MSCAALATVLVAALAVRTARAQPPEAAPSAARTAAEAEDVDAAAAAPPAAAPEAAPPAAAPSAAPAAGVQPPDAQTTPAPPGPSRETLLRAAVAEAEREQPSMLLPWLAAGLGVATLVAGTVVGAINVGACDGSCSTGAVWPWLVVAGCTFTTAGSAWLIVALHDESEARHRLERARGELERDRVDRAPRAAAAPTFTLRAAF